MTRKKTVVFRCDGSPEIGIGHITRCMALAEELQNRNIQACFAMRRSSLGIFMVEERGYQVISSKETGQEFDYAGWLKTCVRDKGADAIVFDVRDGLSRTVVKELRNSGILTVTIDDPEEKRLEADMAFYPPVPQVKQMDWTGFTGKLYSGWEWVILCSEFANWRKKQDRVSSRLMTHDDPLIPKILVSMGGSDPAGLTLKAVQALNMLAADFYAVIVLGPWFAHHDSLEELLQIAGYKYTIFENVKDMVSIMAQTYLAIASFGVTAYELSTMGVPSIYLCLTEDHAESASVFVEAGMAVSLGVFTDVKAEMITKETREILKNKSRQLKLSKNARRHIDGQGAVRITNLLLERLNIENE